MKTLQTYLLTGRYFRAVLAELPKTSTSADLAFRYFSLSMSPTRLKSGAAFQQVRTSHDPDIP